MECLGIIDRVVACTRHCAAVAPNMSQDVCIVEDSWTAKTTEISAAKPDLVIASVPYQVEAIAQILAAGIRVLALSPRTLADIYGDITGISNIMGVSERGAELIRSMRQKVDEVRARLRGERSRRVFCEEWGKPIMTSQPWVAEIVEAAGGQFVGHPGTTVSPESVREADPEVIVFAWCGAGDRVPMEKVVSQRNWQEVAAVKTGDTFVIRDEFLTTPGPPLMTGLLALAHALHPGVFPTPPTFGETNVMRRLGEPVI